VRGWDRIATTRGVGHLDGASYSLKPISFMHHCGWYTNLHTRPRKQSTQRTPLIADSAGSGAHGDAPPNRQWLYTNPHKVWPDLDSAKNCVGTKIAIASMGMCFLETVGVSESYIESYIVYAVFW
jgi:hypothetical protein